MILLYIVIATFAGGLLSVVIAASLTVSVLTRLVRDLVSLSAGVLLGTALLNVLPEAFESTASPQSLFATLLAGLLFFFLLEKAELYRHQHHHEGDEHDATMAVYDWLETAEGEREIAQLLQTRGNGTVPLSVDGRT